MSSRYAWFFLLISTVAAVPASPQTVTSDPQGVAILVQSLKAAGGANGLTWIQDFSATGTITYYWAGEAVQGPATVRARGPQQFRLDANLPQGTRSFAVSRGVGAAKETDGKVTGLPYHNTVNLGIVTFPYLGMAAAVADASRLVSYLGLVEIRGRQVHQIRIQRTFPRETDPDGTLGKLCTTDYFLDAQTYLVTKTLDMTHSDDDLREDFTREIEFENYAVIQGVNIPTLVREKIIGQTVWELRLTNISFNTGLTDLDFGLQ